MNLWQYAGREEYFKKIDNQTWVYIINTAIIYNLTQISSSNDTVILFSNIISMYFRLDSQFCYSSPNLGSIYSSKISKGSWIVVYYESKGNNLFAYFDRRIINNFKINRLYECMGFPK